VKGGGSALPRPAPEPLPPSLVHQEMLETVKSSAMKRKRRHYD